MTELLKKSELPNDEFEQLITYLNKNEYLFNVSKFGDDEILYLSIDSPYAIFLLGQLFQNWKIHNYIKTL